MPVLATLTQHPEACSDQQDIQESHQPVPEKKTDTQASKYIAFTCNVVTLCVPNRQMMDRQEYVCRLHQSNKSWSFTGYEIHATGNIAAHIIVWFFSYLSYPSHDESSKSIRTWVDSPCKTLLNIRPSWAMHAKRLRYQTYLGVIND